MEKTGFISEEFHANKRFQERNISSLTISNHGNTDLTVIVGGVSRKVPAFRNDIGVPFGSFNIPGDGTMCDVDMELKFDTGVGKAIIDYRKVQTNNCF